MGHYENVTSREVYPVRIRRFKNRKVVPREKIWIHIDFL
jgi:hypothetical protein